MKTRTLACLSLGLILAAGSSPAAGRIVVRPENTDKALINPGMGLVAYHNAGRLWAYGSKTAPGDTLDWFPGVSTIYFRLLWSDLEPEEGRFRWDKIDSFAQPWIARGKRIAIRVICSNQTTNACPDYVRAAGAKGSWFDYPTQRWGKKPVVSRFWEPVFDDPVFLAKYEKFLKAFAARYDGDESVAFVDIGSVGLYGEGHTDQTVDLSPEETDRINRLHFELHRRILPRTQLIVSHSPSHFAALRNEPDHPLMAYARELGIGLRNDSVFCYGWLKKTPCSWVDGRWGRLYAPTVPVVIETGHCTMTKENGTWHADHLVSCAEAYQASYFSIHGFPDQMRKEFAKEYDALARRVGYRFELREASWPGEVYAGDEVKVSSSWVNVGVTWCHQPSFLAWSLVDEKDTVVWTSVDETFDFRDVYPKIDGTETFDFKMPHANPEARERTSRLDSIVHFGFDAVTVTNDAVYTAAVRAGLEPPKVWHMLRAGTYDLCVSIGSRQGTPKIALPLKGEIGTTRRYRLGKIVVLPQ